MKKIFRYFNHVVLATALLLGCEVSNFDLLEDPNFLSPESANPDFLLNEMQFLFSEIMSDLSIATDDVMRYEALTGSYNDAVNVEVLNGQWDNFYKALRLSNTVETLAQEDPNLLFHNAVNKLIMGYLTITMVDYVGNIPFTEAARPEEVLSPAVDSAENLYNMVLSDIDQAIADINASNFVFSDVFYGGDSDKWIAFANSFKLRILVQARLASAELEIGDIANEINTLLAGPLIDTPDEEFLFPFANINDVRDNRSNYFQRGYIGGFGQYIGNYFMFQLKDSKSVRDPRIRYYLYRQSNDDPFQDPPVFLLCQDDPTVDFCYVGDGYWGLDQGEGRTGRGDDELRTTYGIYPGGGKFDEDDFVSATNGVSTVNNLLGEGVFPVITSSNLKFLQAEAALTLGTNGNPAVLLEDAVRTSISTVMSFGGVSSSFVPTAADVDTYVSDVMDNYAAASSDEERLDVIMKEFYLASFGNSIESYNAYRRTGFPSDIQIPIDNDNPEFPRSFPYPNDAVITNTSLTQKLNTLQVFWDTNPAGFIK